MILTPLPYAPPMRAHITLASVVTLSITVPPTHPPQQPSVGSRNLGSSLLTPIRRYPISRATPKSFGPTWPHVWFPHWSEDAGGVLMVRWPTHYCQDYQQIPNPPPFKSHSSSLLSKVHKPLQLQSDMHWSVWANRWLISISSHSNKPETRSTTVRHRN